MLHSYLCVICDQGHEEEEHTKLTCMETAKAMLPKFQTFCLHIVKDANTAEAELCKSDDLLSQIQSYIRTARHWNNMQLQLRKASMPHSSMALQVTDSHQPCQNAGYEAAAAGEGEE